MTDIPETDSCFNAYISQFSDLPESSKSFHEHRFEKLQQIDISTKEIVEASIDKLDILIEIENLRIIGGFDKKIIEGLVNVEFFMGKLNEDDYYDRILKDDYVGPVFLHLTDDDVELEARFWEQIKCIATHLMFKQYSSVKVFRARFRGKT